MAGQPKNWHNRFKFLVEIDGFISAGFQSAGPLEASVEVVEYREGGMRLADKSPGLANFENITLERGATTNLDDYNWFASVLNAADQTGGADPAQYKRNLALIEQDNNGNEIMRWNIYGAWPVRFSAGEWDATSNEKTIRVLELAYDYFEPAR